MNCFKFFMWSLLAFVLLSKRTLLRNESCKHGEVETLMQTNDIDLFEFFYIKITKEDKKEEEDEKTTHYVTGCLHIDHLTFRFRKSHQNKSKNLLDRRYGSKTVYLYIFRSLKYKYIENLQSLSSTYTCWRYLIQLNLKEETQISTKFIAYTTHEQNIELKRFLFPDHLLQQHNEKTDEEKHHEIYSIPSESSGAY